MNDDEAREERYGERAAWAVAVVATGVRACNAAHSGRDFDSLDTLAMFTLLALLGAALARLLRRRDR